MFLEEGAPVIVQQDAVGLEGVLNDLVRAAVFLDELERVPEEVELHQRRFASLPGNGDLRVSGGIPATGGCRPSVASRHSVLFVGIERFL